MTECKHCGQPSSIIQLTNGKVAVIHSEDYAELSQWDWHEALGYACRANAGKTPIKMHRQLVGATPKVVVDHINHDTLDNRRCNIRVCTVRQNNMNRHKQKKPASSPYKGVSFKKSQGKFFARIKHQGKEKHLGYFTNDRDAALAYNEAAKKYFGPFAYLNILDHQAGFPKDHAA